MAIRAPDGANKKECALKMTCSFASKDMFSCEDGLCTGEVGLVELKIAGGIQYPRLRGGNNRHNVLPIPGQ